MPKRPEPATPTSTPSNSPTQDATTTSSLPEEFPTLGSPFSRDWWRSKWTRAQGPPPPDPGAERPLKVKLSRPSKPIGYQLLNPERLDLERDQLRKNDLPPGFWALEPQIGQWIAQEMSTWSCRSMDLENTFFVAVPSSDPDMGVIGISVSMPKGQIPGPRDRLLLRHPWEDYPSRVVEVSAVGAFRMPTRLARQVVGAALAEGSAYVGMLVS